MNASMKSWWVVSIPRKKIWKSVGMIIPYIMEHKTCLKPPTSIEHYWKHFFEQWWNLVQWKNGWRLLEPFPLRSTYPKKQVIIPNYRTMPGCLANQPSKLSSAFWPMHLCTEKAPFGASHARTHSSTLKGNRQGLSADSPKIRWWAKIISWKAPSKIPGWSNLGTEMEGQRIYGEHTGFNNLKAYIICMIYIYIYM